ncbi:HtaA domain-containing protein [Nesterenkonia pannonica]|uniref:HtaA domain-containing protein n=1 Tax=Nesterenkonia pannonica TaxID=1548602 RepID=UPI002164426E|nr:HtaA domain-containing protein [Nesterenkonia pannonica]
MRGADPADALWWEFKPSFTQYIEALPDGAVTHTGARRRDEESGLDLFCFEGRPPLGPQDERFSGTLRFTGHQQMLDVCLSDPASRVRARRGCSSSGTAAMTAGSCLWRI